MMNQAKGIANEVIGGVQDAVGDAIGDTPTQFEGKARQAAGELQKSYGDALNGFREAAFSNPAGTLAVVAGVSFLLGALWARRD